MSPIDSTPYLAACRAYHARGLPSYDWPTILDFHFQRGLILSTPEFFIACRYLAPGQTYDVHLNLVDVPPEPDGPRDCHIWIFAGSLIALRHYILDNPIATEHLELVTFQRPGTPFASHSYPALARRIL